MILNQEVNETDELCLVRSAKGPKRAHTGDGRLAVVLGVDRELAVDGRQATLHDLAKGAGHVISDIDVWRSANELIKRFGDTADLEAATRADSLLNKGDLEGQRVWIQILKAIGALRRDQPDGLIH